MAIKEGYSFRCKKKTPVLSDIKIIKRLLPNGNIVTIIKGKSDGCGIVATIVKNAKPKPCKSGKPRTKSGRCSRAK